MDTVRLAIRMQQRIGSPTARPAYQYAVVRQDEPSAWTAAGAAISHENWQLQEVDLSTTSGSNFWIRFGVESDASAGATGMYELQPSFERCGTLHGTRHVQLRLATTSDILTEPITDVLPAVGISAVQAAFTLHTSSSDASTLDYGLAYRTSTTNFRYFGDWTEFDGSLESSNLNNTRLIADTLDLTSVRFVQFGVMYRISSAGAGQADLTCSLATRC